MSKFAQNDDEDQKVLPSVAVANLTGGIGKTTITRLIHYMWTTAGMQLRLVSIDSVSDGATSKLAEHGDEVEQITLSAKLEQVSRAKFGIAQLEHWTRLGDIFAEGGHLVDFGANVIQHLLDWAAMSKPHQLLEDAPELIVVVPVTSVGQSAKDALFVLERFAEVEPVFMKARLIVAFNDKYGSVAEATGPAFATLRAYMGQKRIASFDVPEGTIQLGEEHSFLDLKTVHPRDFGKRLGISPMLANTRLRFFTNWLDETVKNAEAVGLGPKTVEAFEAA